jgi:hypothetical protein
MCIFQLDICRTVTTRISSAGIGACMSVDVLGALITVGAGVTFDPFDIKLYGEGCRWSRFEDRGVFDGNAAAAQAGDGSLTVRIKKGDRGRSIRLDGVDGAPHVRVTAPGGQVLESAAAGLALTKAIRIISLEKVEQTVVGLAEPKPGIYKIELLPGSARIAKVSESEDPGPPRNSARVRGTGARRTLEYDIARRDDQKVNFVEVAARGKRPLCTVSGGRGKLDFTLPPGSDRRRTEAQFELAGIGAETRTAAAFSAPSPHLGKPGRATVRRRAGKLLVRWTRVAQAERYEVVTTLADGAQRITRTRRPSVTLARVPASSSGEVRVSAIAPMRERNAATARFRATAQRKAPRFKQLRAR